MMSGSDCYKHNLEPCLSTCNDWSGAGKVVCNESPRENNIPASEQFGLHRPSLCFSRICLYANVPTFLHLLCVTLCEFNRTDMHPCASYGAVVCMPPR